MLKRAFVKKSFLLNIKKFKRYLQNYSDQLEKAIHKTISYTWQSAKRWTETVIL